MTNPPQPTASVEAEAKRLATAVFNRMEVDLGVHVASFFGKNPHKMSDEELAGWGKLAKHMGTPSHCSECGSPYPLETDE